MQSRFQIFACLATLVALFAGRDDADAAEKEVDFEQRFDRRAVHRWLDHSMG